MSFSRPTALHWPSMITTIKCRGRALAPAVPDGQCCLYIRRDVFPDGTFEEHAYVGPEAEVAALARRCQGVDIAKVDALLHQGKSFEAALQELGL